VLTQSSRLLAERLPSSNVITAGLHRKLQSTAILPLVITTNRKWTCLKIQRVSSVTCLWVRHIARLIFIRTGWKSYRTSIQEELADRAARLAEQQAQNRREARLRPLYDQLQTTSPSSWYKIFPSFSKFTQLQNVKPLCGPDRDSLDDPALQTLIVRATSNIRQDLRDYFKSVEVQAFRLIVAANQGVHVSTISNDPRDYDNYNYDDEFRLRATSLFAEHDFSMGNGNYVFSIAPFPAISKNGNWQPDYRPLSNFISVRQVRAVRAMIDAAGLDENWTFISQMDDLGKGFCWLNHPSKTMRQTKYTWVRLVSLLSSAPSTLLTLLKD